MTRMVLPAPAATGFFIVCPRMAATAHATGTHTNPPFHTGVSEIFFRSADAGKGKMRDVQS